MDVPAGHIEGLVKEQEDKCKSMVSGLEKQLERANEQIRRLKLDRARMQQTAKDILQRVEPLLDVCKLQGDGSYIYALALSVFTPLEVLSVDVALNEKDVEAWKRAHDKEIWAKAVCCVLDFFKANPMTGENVQARMLAVMESLVKGPID